uniref:Clathrin/coatomer adaptor adaptin-like N-terminal domain-containing protein n=1 Tax=Physcomitrium patens TaxID=3218 RepID=A0A2K1KH18_PHYPA|nr:hypothetical protein PHYPA_009443 [Physcomitrium patens]
MTLVQPPLKKDDDVEDDSEYSPFYGIERSAVLQEARVFNDRELDARRCTQVITKVLYFINQGVSFTQKEVTDVFFATTKLFQSNDIGLRRMVYLIIKEISPSNDEVIIVTSSLMKDMNSKTNLYRANAIRVLCRITDGGLLGQIELHLKQAVVDKSPVVSSAALVSGIHLLQSYPEIVKGWSNEVYEAVHSKASLVQFHRLSLLHQIRRNDRLALSKLVSGLTKGGVQSPLAKCLLIRYTTQIAQFHPLAVASCNVDLESFISDQNRSAATLAITTLLKTGNESSVERLMRQITNFVSDIGDEFKIMVVDAIRSLCLKFPQKCRSLMNFLSSI